MRRRTPAVWVTVAASAVVLAACSSSASSESSSSSAPGALEVGGHLGLGIPQEGETAVDFGDDAVLFGKGG